MATFPQIVIDIGKQRLTILLNRYHQISYPISSGKNGVGEMANSGCTPRGQHIIGQKIGHHAPINSVFVARQVTGEIYSPQLAKQFPNRDWILSRILWLAGCEMGKNQGSNLQGNCDTKARFIYIHGTPDTEPMGIPLSHGCIRMKNVDIIQLFDLVDENTFVLIKE